jgi:hypothetical protein
MAYAQQALLQNPQDQNLSATLYKLQSKKAGLDPFDDDYCPSEAKQIRHARLLLEATIQAYKTQHHA